MVVGISKKKLKWGTRTVGLIKKIHKRRKASQFEVVAPQLADVTDLDHKDVGLI